MYLLVHLWKAKPAWLKLAAKGRAKFIAEVTEGIGATVGEGAELLGFLPSDRDTAHAGGYTYFAAWRLKDRNATLELEQAMDQVRWHDYFDQVAARGEIQSHDAALKALAAEQAP